MKAKEDGRLGEVIKVFNDKSKKVISIKVIGPSEGVLESDFNNF